MPDKSINLLEEMDNLSKVHFLGREDIDVIMQDMAKRILPSLKIERLNVWLFNADNTAIVSVGEYDLRTKEFKRDSILNKTDFPVYFHALEENKIIHEVDIYTHPLTSGLNELYSRPNDICSLLDIPLRIAGELIGVMCFEKTGVQKTFSQEEISFCLSLSFVFASNMESRLRRAAQENLNKAIEDKKLLIKEVNHRIKNNFTILISLLRISKSGARHKETQMALQEYEQRLFSMLKIHEMLDRGEGDTIINVSDYIKELILEFKATYPQFVSAGSDRIQPSALCFDTGKILHLGLVLSEIILDSIKYASANTQGYALTVDLREPKPGQLWLKIGDNGPGFDFEKESKKSTVGLPLIKDLVESIGGIRATFPTPGNGYYVFEMTS
jgi:two-component sensor histidine kinase